MIPEIDISLTNGKKIYFASDFHLGSPSGEISLLREKKLIRWLESIKSDASNIMLVGDVFDFWYEYKYAIPKGHLAFQAKLLELSEMGIKFYFFPGNHDIWMFDYFQSLLGATISRKPLVFNINQQKFYIVHGDGYGPGDYSHKLLMLVFENPFFQWVFRMFPVNFSFWVATAWSNSSRISNEKYDERFFGEKELLWAYAKEIEQKSHHDYYIFGHRHMSLDLPVGSQSRYINLGEWFNKCNYAVFDGNKLTTHTYVD
ncbi:MAG: UDP-2,3-diacylglucosamine diphosphatase [Bacteroidota bacterium]|nr:UDP-2,3-diacylglucosamine diphosphatase [Bacteroidota bacterium]